MQRLANAWGEEDDWTGLSSSSERKKLQNRLNQRACRNRKHFQRFKNAGTSAKANAGRSSEPVLPAATTAARPTSLVSSAGASNELHSRPFPAQVAAILEALSAGCPKLQEENYYAILNAFLDCRLNIQTPSDLPTLARLNVINALALNSTVLGIPLSEMYRDDSVSPFNLQGPVPLAAAATLATTQNALQPTALQKTIVHHPWIDILPMPCLRDSILQRVESGTIDEDALCHDLLGIADTDAAQAPLTVWGESSDARSWEISIRLFRKWKSLFRDCHDAIEATDYWRARRGEMSIRFIVDE